MSALGVLRNGEAEMKRYKITNKLGKTYYKYFLDVTEARHWIINTLDLSLEWNVNKYESDKIREL